jgi:hypothetical protein
MADPEQCNFLTFRCIVFACEYRLCFSLTGVWLEFKMETIQLLNASSSELMGTADTFHLAGCVGATQRIVSI